MDSYASGHFCPHAPCAYHGWVGFGNLRANGHPNGRRWRQLYCLGYRGYFLETLGTPFPAKQVEPDKLVWAMTALSKANSSSICTCSTSRSGMK